MRKRAEQIETAIHQIMQTYHLDKAFTRGQVRDVHTGEVHVAWRPKADLLRKDYSSGEAIIVSILLDAFHEQFGVLDYLEFTPEDSRSPAETIWPGIIAYRQMTQLDGDLLRVAMTLQS